MARPCGCGKSKTEPDPKAEQVKAATRQQEQREAYRRKLAELTAQPSGK